MINSCVLHRAARGLFRSKAARDLFFRRLAVLESLEHGTECEHLKDKPEATFSVKPGKITAIYLTPQPPELSKAERKAAKAHQFFATGDA